jgi:hypothetical protein
MQNKPNGKSKPNHKPVSFEDALRMILVAAPQRKIGKSGKVVIEMLLTRYEDKRNPEHGWYFI